MIEESTDMNENDNINLVKDTLEEKLINDPKFRTNADRVSNREFVTNTLNEITKRNTSEWWLTELEKQKIGCGPINTLNEVFSDPHVKAREMIIEMEY